MEKITEDQIDELIICPKNITKVDRKNMIEENRSKRNKALLESTDKKFKFSMFLRISTEFIDDFSVGLIWVNPNEYIGVKQDIILMRCQGPHDSKVPETTDIHHSFHIHQITVKDILEARYRRPSNKCVTSHYSSFESAAVYFAKKCNIIDVEKHLGYPYNIVEIPGQTSLY